MTIQYALVYPTESVGLARLTRAALQEVGSANVTVVSGAGSQALRVPEDATGRIYETAGLAPDGSELPPPAARQGDEKTPQPEASRKSASGPEEESPGPDASPRAAATTGDDEPGRPAGRAAGRTAKKTAATKKTTRSRTTRSSSKEGDDQ
jgi:hypothetical protein